MEASLDSVDEAGNISKYGAENLPSLSCQQISEHKGTEEECLLDKTSNGMAALNVKTDEKSAQFLGLHSYSDLMALDDQKELIEKRETAVIKDKCLPLSKEVCPMGQTNVQENCKDSGKDNATVEDGTIVSLSSFSSCLPEKKRNVILSHTGLESQQSVSSDSSQSDHAQYVSEVVADKPDAAVSHHMLRCAETEKGDEKLSFNSLLPVIEKQQKCKAGRPYKKKTQVKMAKRFAIVQHRDSEATDVDSVTEDTLTPSDIEIKKIMGEMQEFPPSNGKLECNVKLDSSKQITTPISHSDGIISTSKIYGPSISIELTQPSRRKRTLKTMQNKEELKMKEVSAVELITATKEQDTFIEQAFTQNFLVPSETVSSIKNSTENAVKPRKRRRKKRVMAFKARNRRKPMLKKNKFILSCHTDTQSQSSSVQPEENNCCRFSQDVTPLQSSNIKLEPKELSGDSVLDVKYNLKNPPNGESPSKCLTEVVVQTPVMMSKCFDISITQKDQGASSDMKREMQENVTTDVSAFGNQVANSTKTQELLQLKNIEDMLKSKRKSGRPYKKKTLFKMAKLLAIAQECVSNDTENIGMREENVPKFQQEVNVYPPPKSEVKIEETNTKLFVINSAQRPSRQSQRTRKTSQNTDQTQDFTHNFIQPVSAVPSDLIEPILKSEETSLISPVDSPIFTKQESHTYVKPLVKNIKSNQNRTTSVSHHLILATDSMTPAKIVSTENGKKDDKNIELPYTSIVSQLFTTGIPLENVHNQDNNDEKDSRTSLPNVPNLCQSEKHGVQDKKVKEKAVVPLSESTALSFSDYPLPVENPSTSQNQSLLKSKNKSETKTAYLTSRVVTKTNSKLCKSRKKTLQNIKKTQVPTLDSFLGKNRRPSDVSQINQMRQVEAVIESVIEDIHKPLEDVGERNNIKEEDSNVSESTLDNFTGAEHRSLEVEHMDPMRQVEAVIESVIQNNYKPLVRVIRRKCMKEVASNVSESVLDPTVGVDHRTLDMPQVDHIRQIKAVIDSVIEDHKNEVSNVHASEKSTFPLPDNQLDKKTSTLSPSLLLQSDIKQESPKIKNAILKTAKKKKRKLCRKNLKKAAMPNLCPSSDMVHILSNVNEDLDKMLELQEQKKKFEQIRQVEAVIESVIENIHKPLINPARQKRKIKVETCNDAQLEEITVPNMDDQLKLHNTSPVAENDLQSAKPKSTSTHVIPKMSTKSKSKVCSKLPFYKNPTQRKSDGETSTDIVKPEKEAATSLTGDHLETATHKPRQCKGPRKKQKIEDMGAFKREQEEPHELCALQQVSLQTPEAERDSGTENTTSEMATSDKTRKSKKRKLPSKKLSGKAKRAAIHTTNSTLGAEVECLQMLSQRTYAEQTGNRDKKTVDNVVKDEKLTLGMENDMETAQKQCIKSKKKDCNVSIPEDTDALNHSALQQDSLLETEVKTESVKATQINKISKACKKRRRNFKRTAITTETQTPTCSSPSLEVEEINSDMASIFPHVEQVQNIVDNTKGSKLKNENPEASHPIRNFRRPSRSNSDVTTDLTQGQPVVSVTSDLTDHLTNTESTTVSSTATQGHILELVSADRTQKTPNKIMSSTKKILKRPKHSGPLYKNGTDDDRVSVKVVSTLLKYESPENRAIEKKRKGKKGKILKTDNLNLPSKHPSQLRNGIAIAEDSFIFEAQIDEAGVTASTAMEQISTGTQRKGLCIATGKKQKKGPSNQPCMGKITESLCVNSIQNKNRIREGNSSSTDLGNADINIQNHRNDLSDHFEFLDSSLPVNQSVKNKGKEKKTVAGEPTADKTVVKEMEGLDFPTTIAELKAKKGHKSKKYSVKPKASRQKNSNTVIRHSVSQKQSLKSVRTSKRGKITCLNPMATFSRRHTRASKAMQLEDIVFKQEHNDTWDDDDDDDDDVSSNMFSPKIATDSHSLLMKELDTSQTIKNTLSVKPGMQQEKSIPLTTSVRKQSHKVTCIRKRRRANKTGWAIKVKSKRPLSVNRDTLEVTVQSSTDHSSVFNLLTENDILENVKQEKECSRVTNNYNVDNVEINPRDSHPSTCTKLHVLQNNLKTRKSMSCNFCGRAFRHISAYTIHKRIHTGEKPYRCQKCGKSFAQLSKLNTHLNTHKQHGSMQCPCCVTKSPNKEDLIEHFKIHLKGARKINLNNRTREIQIQPYIDYIDSPVYINGKKSFRCSSCFKDFFSKATLKMHLQTHSEVRGFICKICCKKFSNFSSLNAHEKTHWPVKPYACSVCGKGFVLLRELKTHSNMHSGEMPFFCKHCSQSFSELPSLRSHQLSKVCFEDKDDGSGKKIDIEGFLVEQRSDMLISTPMYFKCQICKQLYRQWCQYILHLQTHTNNKPNLCEICGQQYDQQVSELCVHCKACCKSSGEQRACNSALSEVWHGPQPIQDQISEPDIDSLYKDHQDTPSTDHPHPQCKEPEPLQSLETTEVNSSDDRQNPSPAGQSPGNRLEVDPHSPSNSICARPGLASLSQKSCSSGRVIHHPSGFRSCLQTYAACDRYSCRRCGKSFNQWNKLWLHQGLHREKHCSFSCTQCNLEFRFFGSYREHMREHRAQSSFACPLCPKTYIIEEDLNTHLYDNHQPVKSLTCDTCGKGFTSSGNLERHQLLHRGAISHHCVTCGLLFPSNQALQNHLKSHSDRPVIPLPKGQQEPLVFPYHCRKCNARFTTTDLLQAHQVCHLNRGKNIHSSSANIVFASLSSKLSNKPGLRDTPLSTQKIPCLPLSKKKHLYRYPHPNRLYVVPKVSSQPPVIISDSEEDCQEIICYSSSSVLPCNNFSPENERQTSSGNSNCDSSNSDLPQTSSPFSCVVMHGPAQTMSTPQEDTTQIPIQKSPLPCQGPKIVPTQRRANSKGDDEAFFRASTSVVIPRGKNQQFDGFECADCLVTFCDVSDLHEHYLHHARGVK